MSETKTKTVVKPKAKRKGNRKGNNTLAIWRMAAKSEGIVGKLPKKGTPAYDKVKARVELIKAQLND